MVRETNITKKTLKIGAYETPVGLWSRQIMKYLEKTEKHIYQAIILYHDVTCVYS
jgi:hypothetical protein